MEKRVIPLIQEMFNQYSVGSNNAVKVVFQENKALVFKPDGSLTEYIQIPGYSPDEVEIEAMQANYYNSELAISFDLVFDEQKQLKLSFVDDSEMEEVFF